MKTFAKSLRPLALSAAIVAGFAAQTGIARAAPLETLTVAGGCFWCVEADFEKVQGVEEATSGYTGGRTENPTYKEVSRGGTGHYEAVEIKYDPDVVSYAQLLDLFFRSIDPLDAGGQFCDRGESYRTAIFVENEEERRLAEEAKATAEAELGQEVVTPILDAQEFYVAEEYHQDYYKSDDKVITRFGWIDKQDAYDRYREGCRRDERIIELWGPEAPFV